MKELLPIIITEQNRLNPNPSSVYCVGLTLGNATAKNTSTYMSITVLMPILINQEQVIPYSNFQYTASVPPAHCHSCCMHGVCMNGIRHTKVKHGFSQNHAWKLTKLAVISLKSSFILWAAEALLHRSLFLNQDFVEGSGPQPVFSSLVPPNCAHACIAWLSSNGSFQRKRNYMCWKQPLSQYFRRPLALSTWWLQQYPKMRNN